MTNEQAPAVEAVAAAEVDEMASMKSVEAAKASLEAEALSREAPAPLPVHMPPSLHDTSDASSVRSKGSTVRSRKKKKEVEKPAKPLEPEPPTPQEVVHGLSDIGRSADGLNQAYLTFAMHNHPGTKTTEFLTKHTHLQKVLLSNNRVQDATSLGKLVRLTHLDVSHNALTDCLKIEPPLPQLRYARLCHNSIAVLRPLAGFRNLQELWLDNNQLRRLSGLEGMVTLRVLSACSNQLETLEGLEGLQLHELYVNDNQLTTLEPIHSLQALRVMQARANKLSHLRGCEGLTMLGSLDVSDNQIHSLEELKPCQGLRLLQAVNIQGNLMMTISNARLNVLNILPGLLSLGPQTVSSNEKVYAANMHGDDFYATRAIRQTHFPAGELDDGGNAEPPLCVMLPASDGTDGVLRGEVDELAESAAAMEAVLVEEDPAHNLAELFRDKYTDELDLLRACFVWMVRNGQPMPHCKGTEYHEAAPVLRPELKQFEQAVMPTTGGPESGLWCERITQIFTMLLKKCHVEAHNVIGFYTPAAWMPPQWLPLVSPNSMWTAVFVHNVWRLVDIQEAVQLQSLESFYTQPLEFIKSHMPLVGRWQLTPAPVAKEDFWRDARAACEQATSARAAAAAAAAVALEDKTRTEATAAMVANAVWLTVEEDRCERELPVQLVRDAIAKAIASES